MEPWEQGSTQHIARETLESAQHPERWSCCGLGSQWGAWREGADYLQAAGWQCPLLAARQDNSTEESSVARAPPCRTITPVGGMVGSEGAGSSAAGQGMAATLALLCLWGLRVRPKKAYGSA